MNKYLVIQTASIGDVILVTPVLEALHHQDPGCRVDILVKGGNESLFAGHPFIHKVWVWNKKIKKYHHLFELLYQIRIEKFDAVINAQRFASSGFLTIFSGARKTIGFDKNPFSSFFSKKIKHIIGTEDSHEAIRNLRLLEPLGIRVLKPKVRLYPSEADYQIIKDIEVSQYITISPASLWFTKQYPENKWAEFLSSFPRDMKVFFLGAPNESELIQRIIGKGNHPLAENMAGKLSLLQSAALMKEAMMNYVNDSAPMHLCSSVNAKVTVIYCSTVPAFGFGPLSEDSEIVEAETALDCRPCGIHGHPKCPKEHFNCAMLIRNSQLLKRLHL